MGVNRFFRRCNGRSCASTVTCCSRSDRWTATKQNKRSACHVLLQCHNNALACELVLQCRDMLLLIVVCAKDIGMQTRIQKTNDMNFICPILIGIKITSLTVVVKLTTTKVLIQRASTLLRMSLNQNSILRKRGMIRQNQEHQRFVTVRIMFNLIGLRMSRLRW